MSGSHFTDEIDLPTYIRRMPPCDLAARPGCVWCALIREFCERVRSGEITWR